MDTTKVRRMYFQNKEPSRKSKKWCFLERSFIFPVCFSPWTGRAAPCAHRSRWAVDPLSSTSPSCLPNRTPHPLLLETNYLISKEHRGCRLPGRARKQRWQETRDLSPVWPDSPRGTAGASASWGSSNTYSWCQGPCRLHRTLPASL